jgi:16S rRNA (guanine966-N2)-methyltransferase
VRIIAGEWRGRVLSPPAGRATRPTSDRVREAWMSALQFDIPDSRVLDLFAGSGALGLEALSRGASHATFVETASRAIVALRTNIERLDAEGRCSIVKQDAIDFTLRLEPGAFDLAFADPPYGHGLAARIVEIFGTRSFAESLWVEHRSDEVMPPLAGARTRRYGDTSITSIPGPQ